MHHYPAQCLRIIDGDTVTLLVDLGFDTHVRRTLSLFGIRAPKISGDATSVAAGETTKRRLADLLMQAGDDLCVRIHRRSGEYHAELFPHRISRASINDALVDERLAIRHLPDGWVPTQYEDDFHSE